MQNYTYASGISAAKVKIYAERLSSCFYQRTFAKSHRSEIP